MVDASLHGIQNLEKGASMDDSSGKLGFQKPTESTPLILSLLHGAKLASCTLDSLEVLVCTFFHAEFPCVVDGR